MAETDTGHLSERLFPTLSGGEQTRVSLARVRLELLAARCFSRWLWDGWRLGLVTGGDETGRYGRRIGQKHQKAGRD